MPRLSPAFVRTVVALAVFAASGCVGAGRTVTPDALRTDRAARQAAYVDARAALAPRLADRVAQRGDRTLDVLILSGGGQHGAFGAGFLNGWADRAATAAGPAMPTFDAVTGISTGALQAPLAFAGTPNALDLLADLYRHPDRIAPERDILGALFGGTGGLFDTSNLAATLADVYDADLVARLQREFADGRQLFVGTTDLDLGRGRVWSVAQEADATPAGVARLHRLLLASSAIPGAFSPVEIDGRYHTDGGIASNLLAVDLQLMRALADELRARGLAPVTVRVWAIVNLYLAPPVKAVDVGRAQAVSGRATGLLFALAQQQALTRLWEISEAVNSGDRGLRMELCYAAIPDEWAAEPGAEELFDATYMHRLQDYGYERGRADAPWDPLPPGPFE